MVALVKLIGIVMVALGTVYLAKPPVMKEVMRFWLKENRFYLGGVLNILVGIIFVIVASNCMVPWFIILMGIISLIKGILVFVLGLKKITAMVEKLEKSPVKTLRTLAIIVLALGVLLIYSA